LRRGLTLPDDLKPIDTSNVQLTREILDLQEPLAAHVHEVWASHRRADGWIYGLHHDADAKTHPCLVSYGELPDSEKQYDRHTALETLKAIVALGYTITR
jgi:hypothetical protein